MYFKKKKIILYVLQKNKEIKKESLGLIDSLE